MVSILLSSCFIIICFTFTCSVGSRTEDGDLIEYDNQIFDKHTAALRSDYGEHDAMFDSMCIELDQSDSSEDNSARTGVI